jgi:biopolymer transport protein ExbD
MAGGANDNDDDITGINVTPLVDVMLVLLIIFMLTANYVVNRSIEVKLPSAETADEKVSTLNLAFVLDKNSELYLDGKPIRFDEVPARIASIKAQGTKESKNPQAMITADEATPHGSVVKLIDTVRKNGITEFAINVEVPAAKAALK